MFEVLYLFTVNYPYVGLWAGLCLGAAIAFCLVIAIDTWYYKR